jgi:hypothetical protein
MIALFFGVLSVVLFIVRRELAYQMVRFWIWYRRFTGFEKSMLQRRTGLKIRSTVYPSTSMSPRVGDLVDQIMGGSR